SRKRARDVLLGAGQEEPWTGDFDRRKPDQRHPAVADLAQPAAPQHERHEEQRRDARADEDEGRGRELANRDPDTERRDAPDHAHGGKQQETAARHDRLNLPARPRLPYSLVEEKNRPWLD